MKVEFNWRDYDDYAKWLNDVLTTLYEENKDLRDEKVKLLSENQQLKKQKEDVVDWLNNNYCYVGKKMTLKPFSDLKDLLRMLGEIE